MKITTSKIFLVLGILAFIASGLPYNKQFETTDFLMSILFLLFSLLYRIKPKKIRNKLTKDSKITAFLILCILIMLIATLPRSPIFLFNIFYLAVLPFILIIFPILVFFNKPRIIYQRLRLIK